MQNIYIRRFWLALACVLIILALLSTAFRALTPLVRQHKQDVEQLLSRFSGEQVQIDELETGWFWFEPVLKLNNVRIIDANQDVISLKKLQVGINLFSSLWHWQIQPGMLVVEQVHLDVRQETNRWTINGFKSGQTDVQGLSSQVGAELLKWMALQQKIILRDIAVRLHFSDGTVIPVEHITATVHQRQGWYQLKAQATLKQTTPTSLDLRGLVQFNPNDYNDTNGEIYVSIQHFLPYQWQRFWPHQQLKIEGGKGNARIWLGIESGTLHQAQAKLNLHNLSWTGQDAKQQGLIQRLSANMAWMREADGWKLTADHIKMRIDGVSWPENQLALNYQSFQKQWQLKIKHLDLQSLQHHMKQWHDDMTDTLSDHIHGRLQDTTLMFSPLHPMNISTRFLNVGWEGKGQIPTVDHVQGVFDWEPSHGMLELDSNHVLLAAKKQTALNFKLLHGILEWKKINQAYRFHLERLAIVDQQSTVTARGAADVSDGKIEDVRLHMDYALTEAQKWLAYLPHFQTKPKLDHWLHHDIHRIGKLSGSLAFIGAPQAFPFDKKPGRFEVNSFIENTDLVFAKKWPAARDIQAELHYQGRDFQAEVQHATLGQVTLNHAVIQLPDIGLGRETLQLTTALKPQAEHVQAYLAQTPLIKKIPVLKQIHLQQPIDIALNLKAPLYPENNEIILDGQIKFDHNPLKLDFYNQKLMFDDLKGWMHINQRGIDDSRIHTTLYQHPLQFTIHSVPNQQNPYTEINMTGQSAVDILRQQVLADIPPAWNGTFNWVGQIKITKDSNDLDNMRFSTNLKGVHIDAPPPFAKSADEEKPLQLNIDFNPDKAVRLQLSYAQLLGVDFWFNKPEKHFVFDSGEIRLGSPRAIRQKQQKGLQVIGTLSVLDVAAWHEFIEKMNHHAGNSSWLLQLAFVDVQIKAVKYFGRVFKNLQLKAHQQAHHQWLFAIEQAQVSGSLLYDLGRHELSGHLKHLELPLPQKQAQSTRPILSAHQVPHLNLQIDKLKVGSYSLGSLTLDGSPDNNGWKLQHAVLNTPWSRLAASGEWRSQGEQQTSLKGAFESRDLSATMSTLHLPQVIFAHQTKLTFDFSWSGAPEQFSLSKLHGHISSTVRDGHITELSKETEDKLGLGRLLSILSLQTIPRRLKLDFSDLSDAGYAFDIFKGDFVIQKGIMRTKSSYIDGPVAYAGMQGALDLVHRTYDVDLRISPHITASLPLVATIAGGPVAGVAAWVVNKIISKGMQKVSAWTYRITGPWSHPVVQQVKFVRQKKQ